MCEFIESKRFSKFDDGEDFKIFHLLQLSKIFFSFADCRAEEFKDYRLYNGYNKRVKS